MEATMTVQECLAEARFWYEMYVEGDLRNTSNLNTAMVWLQTAKKIAEQEVQNEAK